MTYPLAQVLEVKKRRVEKAEEVVKEKMQALENEKEKLKKCEEERDKVIQHYNDKLQQLRDEFDKGTTSPKVLQIKAYLKVVKERVETEKKKVAEQEEQVEVAKRELEAAQEDLRQKRIEVDKIEMHKKGWMKEMRKEMQILEERELDELGNVIYTGQKKKAPKRRGK